MGKKTEDSKDSYGCSDSQPLECLWKYVLLQHSNSSIGLVVLIYFTNGHTVSHYLGVESRHLKLWEGRLHVDTQDAIFYSCLCSYKLHEVLSSQIIMPETYGTETVLPEE